MKPSAIIFAALALVSGPVLAAAEPVQIKPSLLRLNGNLELPAGEKVEGENVVLIVHGMLSHYGQETGVRMARKHLGWYSKGLQGSAEFRAAVNREDDAARVKALVRAFYQPQLERQAA